jgi:pyruvate/2-oxoglutarate dehydrogenase complex dihydrolipoamide acyltransferase (E2) component
MKVLQKINVPQESVNDEYLTVIGLPFKNGEAIKKEDVLIELETSKASVEIHAETDGFVLYHCKEGDEVPLNTLIVEITDIPVLPSSEFNTLERPSEIALKSKGKSETPKGEGKTLFSKKAEALLLKHNLDKMLFSHLNFVNEESVLAYIESAKGKKTVQPDNQFPMVPTKDAKIDALPANVTFKKISAEKRREIAYLSSIQKEGLVNTIFIELELPSLFEAINSSLNYFKNSILPVVIYECSRLLVKYPVLNSFFMNGDIAYYNQINVGFAIDIDDNGLKVVKVANAEKMSILEIEEAILQLSNKYLDRKLSPADLSDITFTITDLSANHAYFFSPLVNKGNAAILGISKLDEKLKRVILSVSFDHRVTEGKVVSSFMYELKQRIESYIAPQKKMTDNITCYKCMKPISEDYNDIGFIKVVNGKGEEKLICDACLFIF